MATTDTTPAPAAPKKAPAKAVKASKKAPIHETHGALPAKPTMNMIKAFGIKDGYTVDSLDEYNEQLDKMTNTDIQNHAHTIGVVPIQPRDKLVASLTRKFQETKMAQRGPRVIKVATNPAMSKFMQQWQNGEFGR